LEFFDLVARKNRPPDPLLASPNLAQRHDIQSPKRNLANEKTN
jgi:hypothetical protein